MITVTKASLLSCILSAAAMAGQDPVASMTTAATPASPESNAAAFNFCEFLASKPGVLYKNDENPWVSYVRLLGRYHANFAAVEGNSNIGNNNHWSETYFDNRRARLGWDAKFLKYFQTKGNVNFVLDGNRNGGEVDWTIEGLDEVYLYFDAKEAFNVAEVDKLRLTYGRIKWHGGIEARTSSNNILTVERSAMSNYLYGAETGAFRPVGALVDVTKGPLTLTLGVFSTGGQYGYKEVNKAGNDQSRNFADWNKDYMLYNLELEYKHSEDLSFGYELMFNDGVRPTATQTAMNDNPITYDWAQTLSVDYNMGRAGVIAEVQYGDNGDWRKGQSSKATTLKTAKNINGSFWGVMVMPYYWIVPSKLQAVVQVMHTASQGDAGISTNSRYVPANQAINSKSSGISGGGRGDDLTTVYTGVNYHLCGDNLKFQAGVEYTNLRTPTVGDGKVEALTYISGLRFNF